MYNLVKVYCVRILAYYTSVGPLWHWHPGAWGWQEHPVVYRPIQRKRPSTSIYCICTSINKKNFIGGGWGRALRHQNILCTIWNQSLNKHLKQCISHFNSTWTKLLHKYSDLDIFNKMHKLSAVPVRSCYFSEHNPLGQLCWRNTLTKKCFPGWHKERSHPWWNSTPGSGDWHWTGNRRGWNTTGWCYCHCSAADAKIWMILRLVKAGNKLAYKCLCTMNM